MSSVEDLWRQMLSDIYLKGNYHQKDDAKIKEILNVSGFIDTPFPCFRGMKISPTLFREGLKEGKFDIDGYHMKGAALAEYVGTLYDQKYIYNDSDDSFVYTYPERLKGMQVVYEDGKVGRFNQIDILYERLKDNKGSNRAVATLYNCGLDGYEEHIPCLNWIQALIRDNTLILAVMFRSNDIYNAFPSNMYLITEIGLFLTDKLQYIYDSLCFGGIYYNCTSAHYYVDEVTDEKMKEIIRGD